jgi:hypothetical protein
VGNGHRLGCLVVTGPGTAEVEERVDTLLRQVRIHLEPCPEAANQARPASTSAIAP